MYLDPGAWSLVAQFLAGSILAVPVLVVSFWKKVGGLLGKVRK